MMSRGKPVVSLPVSVCVSRTRQGCALSCTGRCLLFRYDLTFSDIAFCCLPNTGGAGTLITTNRQLKASPYPVMVAACLHSDKQHQAFKSRLLQPCPSAVLAF